MLGRRAWVLGALRRPIACSKSETRAGSGPLPHPLGVLAERPHPDLGPRRAALGTGARGRGGPGLGRAGGAVPGPRCPPRSRRGHQDARRRCHGLAARLRDRVRATSTGLRRRRCGRPISEGSRRPGASGRDDERIARGAGLREGSSSRRARGCPTFIPPTTVDLAGYGRFLLETRASSRPPRDARPVASPEATGIDGVSLGGVVSRCGSVSTTAGAFGAVAASSRLSPQAGHDSGVDRARGEQRGPAGRRSGFAC